MAMMQTRFGGFVIALAVALGGCATRPINPPITQVDPGAGYRYQTRTQYMRDNANLVILAFSGGGTRAAAFSYGVLEQLRRTIVVGPKGNTGRLLDYVDVITGVSGGSFTALAYGLYGEHLFDDYENRFLKRNVQGELLERAFNPLNWGALSSTGWGRSELAAQLYDDILFDGATFDDLNRGEGPLIVASATDISTGARFYFTQGQFDALCSNLLPLRLSRAAASSSAVPLLLSAVTIDNYGDICHYTEPPLLKLITDPEHHGGAAARVIREWKELEAYRTPGRRYLHLVDGAVSDNVGMRAVLEVLDGMEALRLLHQKTPLDHVRRIIVFVVNSLSSPETNWDQVEDPPSTVGLLVKATGVPIDHYSYEAIQRLRDTAARWANLRAMRDSETIADSKSAALNEVMTVPDAQIYVIDVSFRALRDRAEFDYLNNLPTSFVLSPEAVDRLRAAAGRIVRESPEFQKLVKDAGARIVPDDVAGAASAAAPQ